ncbi:MAG: hypothetical protein Q9195_009299 [Heterodermia aff. obscurata]
MAPWGRRKQRGADDLSIKADKVKNVGLEVLYEPSNAHVIPGAIQLDIIFVSGLGSGGINPWTHDSGIVWPVNLLPKDLPDARVLLWSHSTTLDSYSRILDCARGLLSDIRAFLHETVAPPKVFVARSGGGNIVKEALSIAVGGPYRSIVRNTIGIIFLGTPHHCPENLRTSARIVRFYRSCGVHFSPLFHKLLNPEYLDDQNQKFVERLGPCALRIYSFYENQGTALPLITKRPIVDDVAATSGYPDEEVMPLEAAHRGLSRYTGQEDANYTRVLFCLRLLAQIAVDRSSPHVELADTNISNRLDREDNPQLPEREDGSATAVVTPNGSHDITFNPNMDQFKDRSATSGQGVHFHASDHGTIEIHTDQSSRVSPNRINDSISQTHGQLQGLRGTLQASDDMHDLPNTGESAHLSSASNGEIVASTRPTSLSSEDVKPQSENPLPPTSQSRSISSEPRLPQNLNLPPDPAISDSISVSNNPASSDYLVNGSQAVFRAVSEAKGLTVAEKTAIANACFAGTGLIVTALNPLIASKSLSVARENLNQAKISAEAATRSASAGTRSARYAKKISRSQRHVTKDDSSDDSEDSFESSDSSKGFKRPITRRHKGRAHSKKHSVYRTDIQRLEDLPKPPEDIDDRVQFQTSRSTPRVERVGAQDRPVQAIAYDGFGEASNVDIDETYKCCLQNDADKNHANDCASQPAQSYRNSDNDAMLPFTTSAGGDELHRTTKMDPHEPNTQEPLPQEPLPHAVFDELHHVAKADLQEPNTTETILRDPVPQASNGDEPQQPRVESFVPSQNVNEGATLTTEQREVTDDIVATKLDPKSLETPAQSSEYTEKSQPTSKPKERAARTSVSSLPDLSKPSEGMKAVERDAVTDTSDIERSSVRRIYDHDLGRDDSDGGIEMDVIHGREQSSSQSGTVVSKSNSVW